MYGSKNARSKNHLMSSFFIFWNFPDITDAKYKRKLAIINRRVISVTGGKLSMATLVQINENDHKSIDITMAKYSFVLYIYLLNL